MASRQESVPLGPARGRVVILGAGFAGLSAAKELSGAPVDVVVVDERNYHTFQPLLYQVATAGLNPADVAYPVRSIFRKASNIEFRRAAVDRIDVAGRGVHLAGGQRLDYDHLIVATGATTNFFGVEGAEEHAFPLYRLEGAVRLRNHLVSCFEQADLDPSPATSGVLTFVIVGGGPTGVELAGALVELFQSVLYKDYPRLPRSAARIVLFEMAPNVLTGFHARSQRHAHAALVERGVEVRAGETVAAVEAGLVRLVSGEELATRTVIWAAGVSAGGVGKSLGAPPGPGGRVVVSADLSVSGRPEISVAGDLAAARTPGGGYLPQLAPVAIQQGRHAARQILNRIAGRPTVAFTYRNRGIMATIGRRSAVAELRYGVLLQGSVAWLVWLFLHLVWLIGFRNRLSVLINWAWNYLAWERGPRLILELSNGNRARGGRTSAVDVADDEVEASQDRDDVRDVRAAQ